MSSDAALYGWDTAFALRAGDFNRLIAPDTDTETWIHPPAGPAATARLSWRFGPWQVVAASGSQIEITLPLAAGSTLTVAGQDHEVSGCRCELRAELVLEAEASPASPQPSTFKAAKSPQWAYVDVDPGTSGLTFTVLAELRTVLTDWFTTPEAAALFNHHFDGVNIDRTLATGVGAAWLLPHATGYAGAAGPDGGTLIGLLTRTSSEDTIGAEYMLSPYAIPAGADAGLVIATPRFLESMIGPALMNTFGLDVKQLLNTFCIDGNRIFSLTTLTYPLKGADGKVFNATIEPKNFSMQVDGDALVLSIVDMSFDVGIGKMPLETIQISMTERLQPVLTTLDSDPNHRVLLLSQVGDPSVQRLDNETLWALGGQLLVDVVATIVGILLSKFGVNKLIARGLSPIAAKIVASILAVVAQGIGMAISHIPEILTTIAEDDLKKMPDFGIVLHDALSAMQWKTDARFTLSDVQFASNLQIGVSITA